MALAVVLVAAPALAQPGGWVDPASGIEFVTVGAPGNAPWAGNGTEGDMAIGRGSVGYEFRIGKFEVTTAQWVEFFNAAYDRADAPLPHLLPPNFWGAAPTTPNNPGRQRWTVPSGNEMRPVGNISWRMAAMYCNWLHNDKATNREGFLNGAYDVSTFGFQGTFFTDQLTRHPDARYWIPSWDEWLKAAHYDPNKVHGDGTTGGWWLYPTGSDSRPAYGPPGVRVRMTNPQGPDPNGPLAQANAAWTSADFPGYSPFTVPLGAYPDAASPWGALDMAGGTGEWTEFVFLTNGVWPTARGLDGSHWTGNPTFDDRLTDLAAGDFPNTATFDYGLRIAATIPSPGACMFLSLFGIFAVSSRTRRGGTHATHDHVRSVRGSWGGVR